jgi:hypothetical protein
VSMDRAEVSEENSLAAGDSNCWVEEPHRRRSPFMKVVTGHPLDNWLATGDHPSSPDRIWRVEQPYFRLEGDKQKREKLAVDIRSRCLTPK